MLDHVFQPTADWVHERTGWTSYRLAIITCWTMVVLWATQVVFCRADMTTPMFGTIAFVIWSLTAMVQLRRWEQADSQDLAPRADRVANPARLEGAWVRRILLILSPLFLMDIISYLFFGSALFWLLIGLQGFTFIANLYFAACTPKPRSPLKAGNKLAAEPSRA